MMVLASSINDVFECVCHTDTEDHEAFVDWLAAEGERVYVDAVQPDPMVEDLDDINAEVEADAALAERVESGSWA